MKYFNYMLVTMVVAFVTASAVAKPIIYPSQGQDAEQQKKDEGECHVWAVDYTGIDPAALAEQTAQDQSELAQQSAAPAQEPEKRRGGALKGAAAGAVIGEIADDDAGKGAAYGAAAGVLVQRRRNVKAEQASADQYQAAQQDIAAQQQALSAEQQAQMDTYYRAFGACMTGRGYTVS